MIRKLSQISLGVAAATVLMISAPTIHAQETFLNSASGGAVRDPFGNCLLSRGGSPLPECLPAVAVEPEPEPEVLMVSLDAGANFDFDSATLRPEGRAALDRLAQDMRPLTVRSVDIVGHTDSIGTEEYNQGLSEQRAASAADHLVQRGVNPAVITTRGESFRQPIAPNRIDGRDNPAGRAMNRRVDIMVDAQRTQ